MEQATRNKLRNAVTQCRRLLEEAVSHELQGKFGIYTAGKKDEVQVDTDERMVNLSDEDRSYRKDLLDHLEHIKALSHKPKDALAQLIREIAFTHLNRLCAYKMMEAREVYVKGQKFREAVSRGLNSNGVKFFLADHPDDERLFNTGHQDIAYRHFLDWLGGQLSEEIGVLFNPNDPANRLYPRQKTLDDVLALINDEEVAGIWSQDETIGWVYQYFTPKELRDEARDPKRGGSQAPRNSYELAFRNQFFTPRYVVEFLTDNTLGRIWYEMRKGETRLTYKCRYMVRRPTEIFMAEGESAPTEAGEPRDDLPQEELLKLPVYIAQRPKRDPRELKILDPACGSGHFLLYCFDLLLTIYEEAFADPELGPALQRDYPTHDELLRDVPRLILAHNLHGIDIDLRCTQIAALALWLRCQRSYQDMGLKKDRPKITRSNLVCAEPMPGEMHMLKEFVGQLEPKLLGQLVDVVFEKMKLAGEAGSLLRIEEEIRDAVAKARLQWQAGPVSVQRSLFDDDEPIVRQQRFDLTGITDAQFFEQAEGKVVEALRNYAERAQNGQRLQRRLFTEDAVRGFAFVDLCHKQFNVVLMNPPFGLPTESTFTYLGTVSKPTYVEMYASFVERWLTQTNDGFLGAITSRSFLTMSKLAEWRRSSLLPRLSIMVDLGNGIMDDAMVRACAFVVNRRDTSAPFFVLDLRDIAEKEGSCVSDAWIDDSSVTNKRLHSVTRFRLKSMPDAKILYLLDGHFLKLANSAAAFEPSAGAVRQGLTTFDDFRFLRLFAEVSPSTIGRGVWWEWFSKGGEYARFFTDVHLLVNRSKDGAELAEANKRLNGQTAQSRQSSSWYYRRGMTFTSRSDRGFSVRVLPEDCVISHNAPCVYPSDDEHLCYVLGWLNSRFVRTLVELQATNAFFVNGSVKSLPWIEPPSESKTAIAKASHQLTCLYRDLACVHESSSLFCGIPLGESLARAFACYDEMTQLVVASIAELQSQVSSCVDGLYECDSRSLGDEVLGMDADADVPFEATDLGGLTRSVVSWAVGCVIGRWDIRRTSLGSVALSLPDPFKANPIVPPACLIDVTGLPVTASPDAYPLRIDWDGILVDDSDHSDDIIRRVRDVLEVIWKDRADAIEREACEILGVAELRGYFCKPGTGGFWDDHVKRYSKSRRKAPIYWLLQSSKKNYGLWLYYHRLDKDLLFKALVNYVGPKIRREESRLDELRSQKTALGPAGRGAKKIDKEIERQEAFVSELRDFEDKLRRAADLHLDPDLNDGVVLNIAPLWELVPWKEAKAYWADLMKGEYEWSSIGKQLREKGLVKC